MTSKEFQLVFDNLPGMYLLLAPDDPDYTILAANKSYRVITRTTDIELEGNPVFSIFPDTKGAFNAVGKKQLLELFKEVIVSKKSNQVNQLRYDIPANDGSDNFIESYWKIINTPVFDDKGNAIQIINSIDNITDQVLSEIQNVQALAESEERYKKLFYTNPMPMWIYTKATSRFKEVNDAAIFKYGYSREEFLSLSIFDIRPEEDIDKVKKAQKHLQGDYLTHHDTWRHFKKDGTLMYVEITAHHITHNNEPSVLVLVNDITEKKKEEERLRLMEMVVNNTNDAILITEAEPIEGDGPRILYVNNAFTRMTGYTEAEVIGKTPRMLQGPDTDLQELYRLKNALKNGNHVR